MGSKIEVKKAPVDKHANVMDILETFIALKKVIQCKAITNPETISNIISFLAILKVDFFNITLTDFMWLGILASICTAYAFIASVNVMKYISPYTVMLTINLEPVYGIALAVLIFEKKEQMSFSFYIGATIILITVILNGLIRNRKKSS